MGRGRRRVLGSQYFIRFRGIGCRIEPTGAATFRASEPIPGRQVIPRNRISLEIPMSQKSYTGLTSGQFQQVFDTLVPAGWRPIQIQGHAQGGESRFDVIWELKGGPDFVMHHDMTAAQYSAHNQDLTFGGYHITLESSWAVNGEARFWAMWEK
jgi:hypothetical protein